MRGLNRIVVTVNEANQRIDRFLRKYLDEFSLSDIYKLLRKKGITVNGKRTAENYRLVEGDVVEIYAAVDNESADTVKETDISFSVLFEDVNIIIVDKPPGLILHPDTSHRENTLVDQVLYYLYKKGEYKPAGNSTFRPSCVNRLDLNTGGIVIFAKNYPSLQSLSAMMRERLIEKRYIAVVKGNMSDEREVKAYLEKDSDNNTVSINYNGENGGKAIHTSFSPIGNSDKYSLVKVNLITGRSHQIRAQLASLGCPIVGDAKYGDYEVNRHFARYYNLRQQFLYAYEVLFRETRGDLKYLEGRLFRADFPPEYSRIMKDLFDITLE